MNKGKYLFSQIMDLISHTSFETIVNRHFGHYKVKEFSCWKQFLCMAYGQLAQRESISDTMICLRASADKLYHVGIGSLVANTTLTRANESRPYCIFQDIAMLLIKQAKELYKDDAGNEVTSLVIEQAPFAVTLEARTGQPWGVIVGTDYQTDGKGNKLVDPNGFYIPTAELVPLGSVLADFTGGVSTTLSWKGLSAYFLFDYQKGGNLYSLTNTWGKYSGTLKETAENNVRENGIIVEGVVAAPDADGNWVSTGVANTTSIAAVDHYFVNQGYVIAKADVYDASFVKFREFRLLYDMPAKWFSKTPIRGITLGVTGRNLAILKKNVPNIDPESAVSSGNVQGLEGGQLPTERSIGFNFAIRF